MKGRKINFDKFQRDCYLHIQDVNNWCYCSAFDEKKLCNHFNCPRWRNGIAKDVRDYGKIPRRRNRNPYRERSNL